MAAEGDEQEESSSSYGGLTGALIALATLAVVAGILLPPYLRGRSDLKQAAAFTAAAQPVLDTLIEAELAQKKSTGKFWRDQQGALTADATKKALGVDISTAAGCRFSVFPADLEADPTLRIEAKGTGDWEGRSLLCVVDSIEHSKHCTAGK